MAYLSQTTEPPNFQFGLTKDEVANGTQIMQWDEGGIKYKEHPDYMELIAIYVKKEFREKKMGTWFMEWLEEEAVMKGKNMVKVKAWTNGKDDILGRFLVKMKYKDMGNFIWQKNLHGTGNILL